MRSHRLAPDFGAARRLALPLLALLVVSCASAERLARQSDEMLARGDLRGAYEKARRALDKDGTNAPARTAYAAAAGQLSDEFKARVLVLAETDTVGAARVANDYRDLRDEIARYPVDLVPEPGYLEQERRIFIGAARQRYTDGELSLAAGHPKEAWRRFSEAMTFDSDYRDVSNRVADAYQRAITRVAVLPFENQIDEPGLARALEITLTNEVGQRSASPAFRFTRVLSQDEVERRMTVAESGGLTRGEALALGQALGADRVVCGRITGLRASDTSENWSFPIYHEEPGQDQDGNSISRWVQSTLLVTSHLRHVEVSCTYEVVAVRSGIVLAADTQPYETWARVLWSDFRPDGDPDRYRLAPPDAGSSEAERAQRDWNERVQGMSLTEMLQNTSEPERRQRWDDRYRGEFGRDAHEHPVFLGELPPEGAMAEMALQRAWEPVLNALRVLDPTD